MRPVFAHLLFLGWLLLQALAPLVHGHLPEGEGLSAEHGLHLHAPHGAGDGQARFSLPEPADVALGIPPGLRWDDFALPGLPPVVAMPALVHGRPAWLPLSGVAPRSGVRWRPWPTAPPAARA